MRPYKAQKNRWIIDITLGRADRKKIVFDGTYQEALLVEVGLKKKFGRQIKQGLTVNLLTADYLDHVKLHRSDKTLKDQKRILYGNILLFFGNYYPDLIDKRLIDEYQKKRLKEIQAPKPENEQRRYNTGGKAIINKELLCLSALVRWAKDHHYCNDYLCKYEPLKYKRPIPVTLSESECRAFIKAASPFWRVLFLCLYHCGLRKDEALSLTRDRVYLSNKSGYLKVIGKGLKERIVPMTPTLRKGMKAYLKATSGALVFPNSKTGEKYTDIRKAIATTKKAAGITKRLTPHMLRHGFATHLIEHGASLGSIQDLMGHAEPRTTKIYTHAAYSHFEEIVSLLDGKK